MLFRSELKFVNLEAQYQLLKDQINPHFLFNALNISKSLIKNQPDKAEEYLLLLADFLRSSIHFDVKFTTLLEEISLCENFIKLQNLRFGDAVQYTISYSDALSNKVLPFFTLVTLLENTTKHNAFSLENPLCIYIYSENDAIVISNNKQSKLVFNSEKTGLRNINERCKILSGNEIEIIDTDILFTVKIKLIDKLA